MFVFLANSDRSDPASPFPFVAILPHKLPVASTQILEATSDTNDLHCFPFGPLAEYSIDSDSTCKLPLNPSGSKHYEGECNGLTTQ